MQKLGPRHGQGIFSPYKAQQRQNRESTHRAHDPHSRLVESILNLESFYINLHRNRQSIQEIS